jgi:hypothetical protein
VSKWSVGRLRRWVGALAGNHRQAILSTANWIPDSRKALAQEVVARDTGRGAPTLPRNGPRIGVALVFCEEPISFIDEVG